MRKNKGKGGVLMLMLGILCDSNVVFSNCIYISFFHFCLVNLGFINKYDYTAPMKYHTLNKQISCTYKKKASFQ